ncbi:MAG: hypothetical protein LUQ19_04550 [Methanoregula sp.]|nr:hypothetical protein [Methanoregula sp.]
MNLRTSCIPILLAGLVAFSGCASTTGPTPPATVITPEPITPVKTTTLITPLPANEIARIKVDHFGMNPSTETVYEFVGTLMVSGGPYQSVQVILRYPDSQEYAFDLGGMGGSNQTLKPFSLFPADRYKGTNPEKIISLDGKRYATEYRYENGLIAWIATTSTTPST